KVYKTSEEGRRRLLPAVRGCRKALLTGCKLTDTSCEVLASALSSNPSYLRELDLSNNDLKDSGVKLLSAGLGNLHCKLETLRLSRCLVTEEGCASLVSALRSKPLTPERAGPELQSPRRLRSQTALCWTGGSTLQTGETQCGTWWREHNETWT
ncbi:hypothetical protein J4Q44_G00382630, partial [Coregonus suidteri]